MITDRMQASLLYRYFATDEECADEIELSCWRWPWREVFLHAERISAQYGGVIIGMTGRELLRKAVEATVRRTSRQRVRLARCSCVCHDSGR